MIENKNLLIIIYHYVKIIVIIFTIIKMINNHPVNAILKIKWI